MVTHAPRCACGSSLQAVCSSLRFSTVLVTRRLDTRIRNCTKIGNRLLRGRGELVAVTEFFGLARERLLNATLLGSVERPLHTVATKLPRIEFYPICQVSWPGVSDQG